MILIGTLYGLTHQLEVPKQINQLTFKSKHHLLPIEQLEALKLFKIIRYSLIIWGKSLLIYGVL